MSEMVTRITAAVGMVALACGGGGGGGGQGNGASDAMGSAKGDCAGVCAALMASHCFYAGGESDCNRSCDGWDQEVAASSSADCKAFWNAYQDCMVSETLADCGGVATWNPMACRHEWDHYQGYCLYGYTPSTPCQTVSAFDTVCGGVAGKPRAMSCMGDVPSDCAIAGTSNNAFLYCCP